jgi:hypothetical protein
MTNDTRFAVISVRFVSIIAMLIAVSAMYAGVMATPTSQPNSSMLQLFLSRLTVVGVFAILSSIAWFLSNKIKNN